MDKIEFRTAIGTQCSGYLLTWKGFSFGIARIGATASGNWDVIELQTGCSVIGKPLSTRKKAVEAALDILNGKGVKVVKKRIEAVFANRADTKVKGKRKTAHCTNPEDRLKTLCGRDTDPWSVPVQYFKKTGQPCKKCLRLAKKIH